MPSDISIINLIKIKMNAYKELGRMSSYESYTGSGSSPDSTLEVWAWKKNNASLRCYAQADCSFPRGAELEEPRRSFDCFLGFGTSAASTCPPSPSSFLNALDAVPDSSS